VIVTKTIILYEILSVVRALQFSNPKK